MALDCLFTWVCISETDADTPRVQRYRDRNQVTEWLTQTENEILSLDRSAARERHIDNIGWKLENMWPLAWALGFDPEPEVVGGMIQPDVTRAMIFEFLPGLGATVDDLCLKSTARSADHLIALEDRFYCAHNAVRNAQLGNRTVPKDFHPITDGGVVHERRHALTWCVSWGIAWDDTDLNT
jgi:hypothetical protein